MIWGRKERAWLERKKPKPYSRRYQRNMSEAEILDARPVDLADAVDDLERLCGIFERADLPRAARRMRAVTAFIREQIPLSASPVADTSKED